ncbi:MAG TPA: response regulator, partial [Humisphaera sp.]
GGGGRAADGDGDFARLDGLRVVVVDDDDDGREVVRAALSASGAEVIARANAADAFDAVVAHRPDVLISDIAMPGEDGYSLVRRVRGLDGSTRQPLAIAVTAFASEDDRRRAISVKFDHHVAKPVDPAELTRLIARSVRKD